MKNFLVLLFSFLFCLQSFSQKSILIINAYLHVGNGETLASAAVGVKNGKIVLVKNSLAYSYSTADWDTIIDANGGQMYPGFVATNTILGISEIEAVRASNDFQEVGTFNPNVRAQIAYNVESEIIKTVRSNGVLICQTTPRGGVISGSSSIMALDGWNWEDATIKANDGIHVNWPNPHQRSKDNRAIKERSKDYQSKKIELQLFFAAAAQYATEKKPILDLRFEAMKECFNGKKRVYFHADDLQQLNDIIEFVQKFKLPYAVIVGGYDADLVARKLKDAKIAVMLFRTHSLPNREDDPVDKPYAIAAALQKEGVLFCLQNEGDMEAMNGRNLPFLAGTAMAYGLTEEQAIAAISYNACKIVGIDKDYGTVEVGKSATLFVSEGNALDMRTNQVKMAMINGQVCDLTNKQLNLYKKYSLKYKMAR